VKAAEPPTQPPEPWRFITAVAVGGLHSIGFVPRSENLLVVSSSGRALLRAHTGERLARDRDDSWAWYDESGPRALGIGEHAGVWVPVAGLDGGQLSIVTADGWRLVVPATDRVALSAPTGSSSPFAPRWVGEELRAFGFSESGLTVAVAVGSHTLELYGRSIVG